MTAKSFYQGATATIEANGFQNSEDKAAWAELLNMENKNASTEEMAQAMLSAGDAVMYRLFQHVKDRDGHIDEQISKTTGVQTSAKDLTWSYANILSAMQERKKAVTLVNKQQLKTEWFDYHHLIAHTNLDDITIINDNRINNYV